MGQETTGAHSNGGVLEKAAWLPPPVACESPNVGVTPESVVYKDKVIERSKNYREEH